MAIELRLLYGLPIVCIDVVFFGSQLRLENVLLDTGSAGTILDADKVAEIGVRPEGTVARQLFMVLVERKLFLQNGLMQWL